MNLPPLQPALLVLAASVLGAAGQFILHGASKRLGAGWAAFLTEPRVALGLLTYLSVFALTTAAFRKGGTVTQMYPIYALTFAWAALWTALRTGEPVGAPRALGLALLVAGITLSASGR